MKIQNEVFQSVLSKDLDAALQCLKRIRDGHSVGELVKKLELLSEGSLSPCADYVLGQIWYDQEELQKAASFFLKSAEAGYYSGFYRAAVIIEDSEKVQKKDEQNYKQYYELAAKNGHILATARVLRDQARNGKLSSLMRYYLFRFLLGPALVVRYGIQTPMAEQVRV